MPFWIPGIPNPVSSPLSLPFRPVLSTSTFFYVRSDGNDGNDGRTNSAAGAKATWNNAYTTAASFDFNNQTVTLFNGNGGNYTTGLGMFSPWTGAGSLVVDLNGGAISASSTGIPPKGIISQMVIPTKITVQNGTVAASGSNGIENSGPGVLAIGANINFGTCAGFAMSCQNSGAQILATVAQYTSNGTGGVGHIFCGYQASVFMVAATAIFSASPTYSQAFIVAQSISDVECAAATFSIGTFVVTGQRFIVQANSVINTGGASSATFFPGTAAGSALTGGQFI